MKRQPNDDAEKSLLLFLAEVCQLLHRYRARVYEMVHMREIIFIRDGRSILIPRDVAMEIVLSIN